MIGQMRNRIGLYTPSEAPDELGGTVTTWVFQQSLWAGIRPKALTERLENGRLSVTQTYLVAIRYRPCLLYTSPSPRDRQKSRMPSSA